MRTRVASCLLAAVLLASPAAAQRLPTTVTPEHYDLTFAVDLAKARFDGTEHVRVQIAEPTSRIVINALDIDFHEVTVTAGAAAQKATVTLNPKDETATIA